MRVLRTVLFLLGVLAASNLASAEAMNDEVVQQKFKKVKAKQSGGKKTVEDY